MIQYLRRAPTVYERDLLTTRIDALRVRIVYLDKEVAYLTSCHHSLKSCYPAPVSRREGDHAYYGQEAGEYAHRSYWARILQQISTRS